METLGWLAALFCLAVAASAAWLWEHTRGRHARLAAEAALGVQDATMRLLRLSASDQRNVALTLFGHAEVACPPDAALTGLARRLLDMSEDLIQQTDTPVALRTLTEEAMLLMPVIDFAMAQVAAHLGPSRRAWPRVGRTRARLRALMSSPRIFAMPASNSSSAIVVRPSRYW